VLVGCHRAAAILATAFVVSGCAMRGPRGAVAPPPGTTGALPTSGTTARELSEYIEKVRHLTTALHPPTPEHVPTMEERDPELASELLRLAAFPSAEGHCQVAERYRQHGILDTAYDHFTKALALNPRDAAAYEGLARVWRDWGLPQLGLADAHRATFYAPESAAARNTYGTLMQALGRYREARMAYDLAASLDPRAAYAVNNLCYLAFLEGRTDAAIQRCTAALTLDPSLTAARNNLALAFAAAGQLELARAQFLDAGDRASGLYNMGIVYLATGDKTRALAAFDEASRARVTFALARERANQIRSTTRKTSTLPTERLDGAPGQQHP
jgi:tetratricopeptide (TPR) repeat protein